VNGHVIVVDLGYGDAGKGSIVDWLCASDTVHTVVRFNGGAQAGHNVVTDDGRQHTFAQFGSGTFSGARTFLSRFVLVDPLALVKEADHLAANGVPDPLSRLAIDRGALLTTPYHQAANQAREQARGDSRHGSCGMGIGETARYALEHPQDAPRAGDMTTPHVLARKLAVLRDYLIADVAALEDTPLPPPEDVAGVYQAIAARLTLTGDDYLKTLLRQGSVVFEGAQGVLLDEWRGFHPYTTWSTTTFENAETLLAEAGQPAGTAKRLGVSRTYATRHGPGPFPTEDPALAIAEQHNRTGRWQGKVRTGQLDAITLRYAIEAAGGIDEIAVTHLDTARRHPELKLCLRYEVFGRGVERIARGPAMDLEFQQALTATLLAAHPVYTEVSPGDWPDIIADIANAPVTIHSHGPTAAAKTFMSPVPVPR
jgi:adenylosuccinate synthase